jgi:hypothetical protein
MGALLTADRVMTALRLGASVGMLAACTGFGGPPCQRLIAADPRSVETRQCLIAHYPTTLPLCPRSRPAISVDEALGDHHPSGETVTVRGRLARPEGTCTDMACRPSTCCNDCSVGFTLIGDGKGELPLVRWRRAPKFTMDCDFSVPLPWLPKLEILVSGVIVDDPILGLPGGDPLAPPPVRRFLTGENTCRAE